MERDRAKRPAAESFSRLREADPVDLNRRFRETSYAERLQTCLDLSELGGDLRESVQQHQG